MKTSDLQLYMFHFRCPLCGASLERIPLGEYLGEWQSAHSGRLHLLLGAVSGAMCEVCGGRARWRTRKFEKAVEQLQASLGRLDFDTPLIVDSFLRGPVSCRLRFERQCPVCLSKPGPRKSGRYFTAWADSCKVQVGNLLYETGLTLWPILVALPAWASGTFLKQLNAVRSAVRHAGKSMSMLECPQCGRFTTCLYGSPHPKQTGFCRWCVDMGG